MNEVEYTLNNADNNSTRRSGGGGGGKTDADEYYGNRTPGSHENQTCYIPCYNHQKSA